MGVLGMDRARWFIKGNLAIVSAYDVFRRALLQQQHRRMVNNDINNCDDDDNYDNDNDDNNNCTIGSNGLIWYEDMMP